jgi:hypothetical protein
MHRDRRSLSRRLKRPENLKMSFQRILIIGFATWIGWLLMANGISVLLATAGPHGLAAFVYAGFFLSLVGPIAQLVLFIVRHGSRFRVPLGLTCIVDAMSGAISFMSAAWYDGQAAFIPQDSFGAALLCYLCVSGALIAMLNEFAVRKARLSWTAES